MAKFFNSNIRYIRKQRGLSQEEVSNGSGIERSVLSRIENGKIETSIDNAYTLSNYFDIPLGILIGKDLRISEDYDLDEQNKLDWIITDKTKALSDEDKKKIIDIIDIYNK